MTDSGLLLDEPEMHSPFVTLQISYNKAMLIRRSATYPMQDFLRLSFITTGTSTNFSIYHISYAFFFLGAAFFTFEARE